MYYTLDQLITDACAIRDAHGGELPVIGSKGEMLKNMPLEFAALPPHGKQARISTPGPVSISKRALKTVERLGEELNSIRCDLHTAESYLGDLTTEFRN